MENKALSANALPAGWVVKKLDEVCVIRPNKQQVKHKLQDNEAVSFVPMNNLSNSVKYFSSKATKLLKTVYSGYVYFEENDVILAKITPCFENGKVGVAADLINGVGFGSSEYVVYRVKDDNLIADFLYYFFKQESFRKIGASLMTGAVGHKRIPKDFYERFEIPIPPLTEQQKIVEILDNAFAHIDQAIANLEQNIVNVNELFQSKLNQIFSEKGEGWEEKSWVDVLQIKSGKNQKKVENENGKYPIIGSAGKIMGYANDYICEENTTIIGRKGTINNPQKIETKFWNVDTAFGLHALDELDKDFLFYFCLSYDFTKHDKGSGRPSLVKKDLLTITMPVPNITEQKNLANNCFVLQAKIDELKLSYQNKIASLTELKKSLLQKVFTGKLT